MTPIFFVSVYLVGLFLTIFRAPIWGIYLYTFAFYFSPHHTWWANLVPDLRYLQVAVAATFFSVLVRGEIKNSTRILKSPEFGIFLLFLAFVWLASLWSITGGWQVQGRVLFFKHLIIAALIGLLVRDIDSLKKLIMMNIVGGLWLGWQAYGRSGGRLEGIAGALADANTLGMQMSCVAIMGGLAILCFKGPYRWISFASMPLIINTIVLTSSRGAFIGIVIGGIIAGLLCPSGYKLRFSFAALLGAILFVQLSDDRFIDRLSSILVVQEGTADEIDSRSGNRLTIIRAELQMFTDHPYGTGYKGTAILSPNYMDESILSKDGGLRGSHNSLSAVLVDYGVFGLVLYLALHLVMLRRLRLIQRLVHDDNTELIAVVAAVGGVIGTVLAAGMGGNFYHAEVQYWMLGLVVSLWHISNHHREQEEPNTSNIGDPKPKLGRLGQMSSGKIRSLGRERPDF